MTSQLFVRQIALQAAFDFNKVMVEGLLESSWNRSIKAVTRLSCTVPDKWGFLVDRKSDFVWKGVRGPSDATTQVYYLLIIIFDIDTSSLF